MHIGFLTPEYPHPSTGRSGGIGTSIFNLARGLQAMGMRVTVFVCSQNKDDVFHDEGITIRKIRNIKFRGFSWILTRWKLQRIINDCIRRENLSVLESPDWGGLTAYMRIRCPVIIRCNGSDTYFCFLDGRKVKWRNKHMEGKALHSASAILAVSSFTADLSSKLFRIPKIKFTIIPNGIQVDRFPLAGDYHKFSVLYFGTIIRKKGVLELPFIFNEVIKRRPEASLVLVGSDTIDVETTKSTWAIMQDLFSREALSRVVYTPGKPYGEILMDISNANVCVFPSFSEAFPVSWLEAMACGKPIVASNVGWANEMIQDGVEGYLVNPKSHSAFADRVVYVMERPDIAKLLGINARAKVVRDFSSKVIAEKSLDFYKNFVL